MDNKWKETLIVNVPNKIPYDIETEMSELDQQKLLEDTFFKKFIDYNEKFNSKDIQEYIHNLVACIILEYHKYFSSYTIEISYRFKSPKSISDKLIDYMSRSDRSRLEYDKSKEMYNYIIDELKDVFAMKIILKKRPSTFHSKDPKINKLVEEKINNQEFMAKMQEFQNKLLENEFSINPQYLYNVTKKEYYIKCIEIVDKMIEFLDRKDLSETQKPTQLIIKYEDIKKSLEESLEIVETLPDGALIDETDYPAHNSNIPEENIDFTKLLNKFASKIYTELDLAILTTQANSLFTSSNAIYNLGIRVKSTKEKRATSGYISNFVYLDTPIGIIECQLQPEEAYIDGNYGDSAHNNMKGKKIKGFKVPNVNNPGEVKRFKEAVSYVSPKYYTARLDEIEEGKVIIQRYSDYKNYRNVIGQVKKDSLQERALLSYFSTIYSLSDRIFDSNGAIYEFINYDLDRYLKSPNLQYIKDQNVERTN